MGLFSMLQHIVTLLRHAVTLVLQITTPKFPSFDQSREFYQTQFEHHKQAGVDSVQEAWHQLKMQHQLLCIEPTCICKRGDTDNGHI